MSSPNGGGKDLSVGEDMSIQFDLGPADMSIPDDALRPVLYSQFALDYAKTLCTRLAQCGKVGPDAQSQAACQETNAQHFGTDYDTEIMRGHLIVNELQCLDAIANSRCDNSDIIYVNDRCRQFLFKPMQMIGQPCVDSRECINGYCLPPASAGGGFQPAGCMGTCQAFKTTTCDTADSCNILVSFCKASACSPRGTEGADCSSNPCQYGLYCNSVGPQPLVQTCHKPMMQMMMGGACDPSQSSQTTVPACAPGLFCQYSDAMHTAATCQAKIADTMTCDPASFGIFDNACVDGDYCNTSTKKCTLFGKLNDACVNQADCQSNLYCDATNHCVARFADGQHCTQNFSCISTACRVANADAGGYTTCQPIENFAGSCSPGFDNLCYSQTTNSSYCAPANNGGGVCAPKCQ